MLRRDIFIEMIGIAILAAVVVVCAVYMSKQQSTHSVATRGILVKMYELQKKDLEDRNNRRVTLDQRLSAIEDGQKLQVDELTKQQGLLDKVAVKLRLETSDRKAAEQKERLP